MMNKHLFNQFFYSIFFVGICLFTLPKTSFASRNPIPDLGFGKDGVVIKHAPSDFEMAIRFRTQFRYSYEDYEDYKEDVSDFNVRRMRLRFDGTAFDERFLYKIQLSFTRGDLDFDTVAYPNILRDAVIGWKLTEKSTFWFGQTKLPGNRQRVVSSGNQELVDRSLLNSTFNIDRDIGIQWYNQFGEEAPFWLKLAVTNGEGRARNNKDKGMSYTARAEWLPFGNFKDGGDYFEGDLAYEKTPKVSIGTVYNINKNTNRIGGQTGDLITDGTESLIGKDIQTFFIDYMLKYRGLAISGEYVKRMVDDPIVPISSTENAAIYKGEAMSAQISYNFANHISPIFRYTRLFPDGEILDYEDPTTQYTFGLTKYLNKHQVKVQSDITLEHQKNPTITIPVDRQNLFFRIQVEFGI